MMTQAGRLLVLEGPDGVGKSTLAEALARRLATRGVVCEPLSFPGRIEGTLGRHIYELHHDPGRFGVANIAPESLQLLHVAAHLEAISARILPALRAGRWVILDRYWWSTWAYGVVGGGDRPTLDAMIDIERVAWRGFLPTPLLLVRRDTPFRLEGEPSRHWKLTSAYDELARIEGQRHPVRVLENDGQVESLVEAALETIDGIRFRTSSRPTSSRRTEKSQKGRTQELPSLFPGLEDVAPVVSGPKRHRRTPTILMPLAPARPTEVYATYWRFAAERQEIFFRRLEGRRPLTEDPILARHKFTNAYRASDRVSQFLIRDVVYHGDQDPEELFFRTILFLL